MSTSAASNAIVRTHAHDPRTTRSKGHIFAVGGAEEKFGDEEVLCAFVDLAGGTNARIVLIPSASSDPDDAIATYREAFGRIGIGSFQVIQGTSADEMDTDEHIDILSQATGVFMSGGDQSTLAERFCGTRVAACLMERNAEGIVVGGTSAGAAILASHMVEGGEGGATPRRSMATVGEGLGRYRDWSRRRYRSSDRRRHDHAGGWIRSGHDRRWNEHPLRSRQLPGGRATHDQWCRAAHRYP